MTASEIAHGVEPHRADDPVVTWTVSFHTERVASGVPTFDAALAFARDYCGPLELLGEVPHEAASSFEIDGQQVRFVPFGCLDRVGESPSGIIMPELRCRGCRRTL